MTGKALLTDKYQVQHSDDLNELESAWRNLEAENPVSVYQRFDWISTWYQNVILGSPHQNDLQPQLIHIYKNEQLVAILPLSIRVKKGIRFLSWLGDEHFNYMGGVYQTGFLEALDEVTFKQLWLQIRTVLPHYHVMWLTHQALEINNFPSPFRWLNQSPAANSSHQLLFPHHDWDELLKELRSKSTRKRMRNEESRLSREGELSWKKVTQIDDVENYLETLFAQRQERFKVLGIDQESNVDHYQEFYLALLKGSLERGDDLAYMMVIELDQEVLATIVVAQTSDKLYLIINSMTNSRFQQWSPGDYLLRIVMQKACDQNALLIDFGLGEDSNYKTAWCNNTKIMFESIQGEGLIGKTVAEVLITTIRTKRKIKQSPKLWRWYCEYRMWRQSKNKWDDLKKRIKKIRT